MFSFEDLKAASGIEFEPIDINGDAGALFDREQIADAARLLKEKFGFVQFMDVVGHDRNERKMRFEVTYNLRNPTSFERIFIKVRCDERDSHVPSLAPIWSGANWAEREAFDMLGIVFDGHPDLRRMYLPDEFAYYPLRKDFPLMGIPGSIPLPSTEGADAQFDIKGQNV
jgi:NADH-quinone oxidoreductase subunit C